MPSSEATFIEAKLWWKTQTASSETATDFKYRYINLISTDIELVYLGLGAF